MALAEVPNVSDNNKNNREFNKTCPGCYLNGNSVNNDNIAISEMLFDILFPDNQE